MSLEKAWREARRNLRRAKTSAEMNTAATRLREIEAKLTPKQRAALAVDEKDEHHAG